MYSTLPRNHKKSLQIPRYRLVQPISGWPNRSPVALGVSDVRHKGVRHLLILPGKRSRELEGFEDLLQDVRACIEYI